MKCSFMKKIINIISSFGKSVDFESIVGPHMLRLHRVAYRLTGSNPDAEDLVQDVLVKLYPRRDQLSAIEKLGPWLAKVLYRTFLDQQRRNKRSPLHLVTKGQNSEVDILDFIASPEAGPEDVTVQHQTQRRLQLGLNALSQDQRHLCLLFYVEGYTLPELEEILDTPVGTLKSRLHRARTALRNFLNDGTILKE